MTISIQGKKGSYSDIAAKHLFGNNIEVLERDTFKEVFEDLKHGNAQYIVIPVENSTYGSVYQNYDLITQYNFRIIKEIYLKVNFHLIGFPDRNLKDITEVYTHPVAMGQIQDFLSKNPQIKAVEYPDTAGSVTYIKEKNLKSSAAAASRKAAEVNGMKIIQENIQSNKQNYTRFFALEKNTGKFKYEENANKTSLEFKLGEESGSLFKCIKPFAERNISLIKIESRPIINTHWQFTFYLDVKAGIQDKRMLEALKELEKATKNYRIIGSYKKGEYIET